MDFNDQPWSASNPHFLDCRFVASYDPTLNSYLGGYVFDTRVTVSDSIFRLESLYFFDSLAWSCNAGPGIWQYLQSDTLSFSLVAGDGSPLLPSPVSLCGNGIGQPMNFPWLCTYEPFSAQAILKGDISNDVALLRYPELVFIVQLRIYENSDAAWVEEYLQRGFPSYIRRYSTQQPNDGRSLEQFHSIAGR